MKVPTPRFLVFYNGNEKDWSRKQLKLSDSYENTTDKPELELLVTMININPGMNDELLENCSTLLEYTVYVEKVRSYSKEMDIAKAVERAVDESIPEGILEEFLIRYRAEAIQMSIFEYDEERELKLIRADEREIGREEGIQQGIQQGRKEGIQAFILDNIEEGIPEFRIIEKLMKRFGIQEQKAKEWIINIERKKDFRL